jgi:hypothetical protein
MHTPIPLQVHSALALPHSSTAFDSDPTMLTQMNFRNHQCFSDCIHACSSLVCRRSFTALHLKMMHQTNHSNPSRLRGYVYMRSSLVCPHFPPALDLIPAKIPILIPQCHRAHVQIPSWISCPHSSALRLTPSKKSNLGNTQRVFMSSKWLQCGTGRYAILRCVSHWRLTVSTQVLFVAERAPADCPHYQSDSTATPGARRVHSRPIRLLGHIGLFLCCVCNHKHADGNVQRTQQPQGQSQGQMQTHATLRKQQQECDSQGQVQAQASSPQTRPTPPSASATPTVLCTHTTVSGASA